MTKSSLSQHDSLFKKFLGYIAVAQDFLEVHLLPHLRERCDFSTLSMESGSFIEDDLRTQCSDMLYSVQANLGKGYIYTVVEHQAAMKSNDIQASYGTVWQPCSDILSKVMTLCLS